MKKNNAADRFFHWATMGLWALFLGLILSSVARAEDAFESTSHIEEVASAQARSLAGSGRAEVTARLPDQRLRLKKCPEELTANALKQGLRLQVQVSCPGLWKIYVPVAMKLEKQLVVAKRSLQPNELIAAADVELKWQKITGSGYGHFESLDAVIGRKLANAVAVGQILQPNQLRQAFDIHKGDVVTVISRAGPVEIRGRGQALEDVVTHGRVKVKNLSSGKVVQGYAREGGIVEIQG